MNKKEFNRRPGKLIIPGQPEQDYTRPNRIHLAVGTGKVTEASFIEQYARIVSQHGPMPISIVSSLYIQANRSLAVQSALANADWDYLVFLDTDMSFPSEMIPLVQSYDPEQYPIVGGLYFRRVAPNYSPVPGQWVDDAGDFHFRGLMPDELVPWLKKPGLYPCDLLGTGAMAIARHVLEDWDLDLPWFEATPTAGSRGTAMITEDTWFCWQAHQQGYQAWLDTRWQCGHTATVEINTASYVQLLANQGIIDQHGNVNHERLAQVVAEQEG